MSYSWIIMLANANTPVDTHVRSIFQYISTDTLVVSCRQKVHVVMIPFSFSPKRCSCCRYVTLIIMLELMLILQFILTSFLYWNPYLAIPLLLRASNNSFCSDAIFFARMLLCCRYVALNNHAGARVDYELYTHIISISKCLSSDTLVVAWEW
jgi:hypothetical protein